MKKIVLLLSVAFLITSCDLLKTDEDDNTSFSFLKTGYQWNYSFLIEGAASEGYFSYKILSSDGTGYYNIEYTNPMNVASTDMYWYANDKFFADESGSESDLWFPVFYSDNNVGKSWTSPVDDEDLGTITRQIVSVSESVTVPAGTFDNCVKIKETFSGDANVINYIWVHPATGIVKKESTAWADINDDPRIYFSVSTKLTSINF